MLEVVLDVMLSSGAVAVGGVLFGWRARAGGRR